MINLNPQNDNNTPAKTPHDIRTALNLLLVSGDVADILQTI
jgi:hypothetical protein